MKIILIKCLVSQRFNRRIETVVKIFKHLKTRNKRYRKLNSKILSKPNRNSKKNKKKGICLNKISHLMDYMKKKIHNLKIKIIMMKVIMTKSWNLEKMKIY